MKGKEGKMMRGGRLPRNTPGEKKTLTTSWGELGLRDREPPPSGEETPYADHRFSDRLRRRLQRSLRNKIEKGEIFPSQGVSTEGGHCYRSKRGEGEERGGGGGN